MKKPHTDPLRGISSEARVERSKNLQLNVYADWFRKIHSGEKTEDYRAMTSYWDARLNGRTYETITIQNGFDTFAPKIVFAFGGIEIGHGRTEWGAPANTTVFIVRFGERLSEANIEPKPTRVASTTVES